MVQCHVTGWMVFLSLLWRGEFSTCIVTRAPHRLEDSRAWLTRYISECPLIHAWGQHTGWQSDKANNQERGGKKCTGKDIKKKTATLHWGWMIERSPPGTKVEEGSTQTVHTYPQKAFLETKLFLCCFALTYTHLRSLKMSFCKEEHGY